MAEVNFPDSSASPWTDSNGQVWMHDGDGWRPENAPAPTDIYQETAPDLNSYGEGQGWIRTSDMVKFQLYIDVDSSQWVQLGTSDKPLGGIILGYKNVLINGNFRVNQRGFNGDWTSKIDGDYGYDRWYRVSATDMAQKIENQNMRNGITYTLSWAGGGNGSIFDGTATVSGISPLTISVVLSGNPIVTVPWGVTEVQLEQGTVNTQYEIRSIALEIVLCQRYYESRLFNSGGVTAFSGTGAYTVRYPFAVQKRTTPTIIRGSAVWQYYNSGWSDIDVSMAVSPTINDFYLSGVMGSGLTNKYSYLIKGDFHIDAEL